MARIECAPCGGVTLHAHNRCIHCGELHVYNAKAPKPPPSWRQQEAQKITNGIEKFAAKHPRKKRGLSFGARRLTLEPTVA